MNRNFEQLSVLQYRNTALSRENAAFRSGEKYRKMEEEYQRLLQFHNREMKRMELELSRAHSETVTVRKYWSEVMDDLDKEFKAEVKRLLAEIERLKKQNIETARQRDTALDKLHERTQQFYKTATELEEEIEKNRKLTAQVNQDFENSSISSSLQVVHKKIPNSREKTGRKPGGQTGHPGHGRKHHTPTESHEIPAPAEYAESPDYKKTGRVIRKQKIALRTFVDVVELYTPEYRNIKTGQRVHAPFPEGFVNDVNYDGSVKAFTFLLGNECNVSHEKIQKFLAELTDGEIIISKGMINGLCREFSLKTEAEQKEVRAALMSSPVMNTDFTNANVNGESAQVLICAEPETELVIFNARKKKGHEGIQGTLVEGYQGIMVHDHDSTFYKYGQKHQECMQHNIRYLKGSIENEPNLKWNTQMLELIREMLHYRNGLGEAELDAEIVSEMGQRYDKILELAEGEYLDDPPSEYYREGYNLYLRLKKYKESELLFLHDKRVPPDNSLSERMARVYKRKQKQAIVMRSFQGFEDLCTSMGMVRLMRQKEGSSYKMISNIFERKSPPKKKGTPAD